MAYITVADLRHEGITDPPYSTEHVAERITLACRAVDELTRCFFEARTAHVVTMDGRGHDTLFLPYPPATTSSITKIEVGDHSSGGTSWVEVSSAVYEVVMPIIPDGRYNPKVLNLTGTWPKGKRNIRVTGTFGFVEADGITTPPGVRDLALRIAVWNMKQIGDVAGQRESEIIAEQLKDYSYKLADRSAQGGSTFGDPKIDELIGRYRIRRMRVV